MTHELARPSGPHGPSAPADKGRGQGRIGPVAEWPEKLNAVSFRRATRLYVLAVFSLGAAVIFLSVTELRHTSSEWQFRWLQLAGLTLISGWLSVKLPSGRATISISETFVLAGAVLFGPGVGAVLVALDAAVLCTKEFLLGRACDAKQVAFNIAAPAVSIWFAAIAAGLTNRRRQPACRRIRLRLAVFTALYFLLNSGLVTVAISLEQREGPLKIWWANFREFWINFAAGASIAAFAATLEASTLRSSA